VIAKQSTIEAGFAVRLAFGVEDDVSRAGDGIGIDRGRQVQMRVVHVLRREWVLEREPRSHRDPQEALENFGSIAHERSKGTI
jgi:hypothetical protein